MSVPAPNYHAWINGWSGMKQGYRGRKSALSRGFPSSVRTTDGLAFCTLGDAISLSQLLLFLSAVPCFHIFMNIFRHSTQLAFHAFLSNAVSGRLHLRHIRDRLHLQLA